MFDLKSLNDKNAEAAEAREQKVQASLAKLLATENIHVEFKKARTASFNVSTRVLVIPIYAINVAPEVVEMNVAHEVGHALWTNPEDWKAVQAKHGIKIKDSVNVVEDIRINRKIKLKYPGVTRSFFVGYKNLWNLGHYGDIAQVMRDLPTMLLVDRMNLHAKVGDIGNYNFSAVEKALVDRAAVADTWDEVVAIALEVYKHDKATLKARQASDSEMLAELERLMGAPESEDEGSDLDDLDEPEMIPQPSAEEGEEDDLSDMDDEGDDSPEVTPVDGAGEEGDDSEDDSEEHGSDDDTEEGEEPESKTTKSDESTDEAADEEDEEEKTGNNEGVKGTAEDESEEVPEPVSQTERSYDTMKDTLIDQYARDTVYVRVDMPAPAAEWVVPYKAFVAAASKAIAGRDYYSTEPEYTAEELLAKEVKHTAKFRAKHERYVSHLVREFEMKKNAWTYARSLESKSGSLNLNKMHQYKFSDDLFKRVTSVPKGKNHGMIMFIDFSGSMSGIISQVVEQASVLALFCRRVNIPFRVYGFTSGRNSIGRHYKEMTGFEFAPSTVEGDSKYDRTNTESFYAWDDSYQAVELLSDRMTLREFNRAMYALSNTDGNFRKLQSNYVVTMGGTPLDEMILSSVQFVNMLRREMAAEKVTVVMLTDGEGFSSINYAQGLYPTKNKNSVYLKSPWGNKIFEVTGDFDNLGYTKTYIKMAEAACGATYIGYHVVPGKMAARMLSQYKGYYSKTEEQMKMQFRNERFMSIDTFGYSEYFVMWDKALITADEDMAEVKKDARASTFAREFTKMQNAKAANRTFLTKFMEKVA